MTDFISGIPQIGRFRVEAEVGRGGMGVVYRARDVSLNRPVAIKLMAAHLAGNDKALTRFRREATAAANLRHPHIATVYEFGEYDGYPYLAAEWVEGQTLKALLEQISPLPLERALNLFDQLASALDYAHTRGVVHRDIKPGNVLVGEGDHITVVDFGLAHLTDGPQITASGSLHGTPRYMSPEQVLGQPLDGRSDQYSLAIVLYEMLTGRGPYEDKAGPTLLYQQAYSLPIPAREVNPTLPLAVEAALTKALSKKADDRFRTLAEFGAALRASGLAGPPPNMSEAVTTALPRSPTVKADSAQPTVALPAKSGRRGAWLFGLGAAGLACCVVVVFAFNLLPPPSATATSPAPTADATFVELTPAETQFTSETPTPEETPSEPPTDAPTDPATATDTEIPPEPTATPTPNATLDIAAPLDNGVWALPGGDALHTGFVYEGLAGLNAQPKWTRNPRSNVVSGVVAGGGWVVFGVEDATGNFVRALNWKTGAKIFDWPLSARVSGTPILFFPGDGTALAFAPTEDGQVYALNLVTNEYAWLVDSASLLGVVRGLTLADGWLYVATDTGWVHALNPYTGELAGSIDLTSLDRFTVPPAVYGVLLFLAGEEQWVYAIDLTTALFYWAEPAETQGRPTTPPMVMASWNQVVVGTEAGWVQAFSMDDGALLWEQRTSGKVVGLATDGVRVYAAATTDISGDVYAYVWDSVTANLQWSVNTESILSAAPLTDGGVVLVSTLGGEVRYLDAASGTELTERRLYFFDPLYFPPAPAGGWLFVRGSNLYALGP